MLTVTTAATDSNLLTLEELRAATGVTDGSQNAALTTLGARVASTLVNVCRVAAGGVTPPTLRLETLTEVFRSFEAAELSLSRKPVVSIASIVEDDVTLDADDWELDQAPGLVKRLTNDCERRWCARKITVVYDAGWAVVPDDLKLAAIKTANLLWSESGPEPRDPNLKRIETIGVDTVEYWVPPTSDPLLTQEILELLSPYMNYQV